VALLESTQQKVDPALRQVALAEAGGQAVCEGGGQIDQQDDKSTGKHESESASANESDSDSESESESGDSSSSVSDTCASEPAGASGSDGGDVGAGQRHDGAVSELAGTKCGPIDAPCFACRVHSCVRDLVGA
jgi:hypothetical protein